MERKQEKPEPDHKSGQQRKRRKPLTTYSKKGFAQSGKSDLTGKPTIKERDGYLWTHEMTADDEPYAKRIALLYKERKKECKIVKNGDKYEVFVRKG
jgi:adenosyl cobinamide kinase/adenosyl cobinamide phosphate guanylyltransferase